MTRERDSLQHCEQEGNVAGGLGPEDRGPESRTTASGGHSCASCGRPLTGRKERFCSDRCRMAMRRVKQRQRIEPLLETAESTLGALRRDVMS
jgi:hypothetical protein